jgi:pimeloyl-ACP methyl ester carboxylesterase
VSELSSSPSRRGFLSVSAAAVGAAAVGSALTGGSGAAASTGSTVAGSVGPGIHRFRIHEPREKLIDLRRRILATNFPEKQPVPDQSQGPQLATMKAIADYWAHHYNWRRCEARFNSFPNFLTEIDGTKIHFIHARSKHENALPILMSHGWPGSILEQMKLIEPLTNPTAYGGKASDAFHVVIPSMPGYGYSDKPTETGQAAPDRIGRMWLTLMKRLGYTKFVASGGDWGALIVELMALEGSPALAGIHTNLAAAVPPEIDAALSAHLPVDTTGFSPAEKEAVEDIAFFNMHIYYAYLLSDRPQTMTGLTDSPIGLAAWMIDHDAASLALISRVFAGAKEGLSREDVLDNITHYWLTESGVSSGRIYADNRFPFLSRKGVTIPVAVSVFPDELYEAPRSWTEEAYPNLIHYNQLPVGGHFAAWEQPRLFVKELRTGLRSLR